MGSETKKRGAEKGRLAVFRRVLKILILVALIGGLLGGIFLFCINAAVKGAASGSILTPEEAEELRDVDCILVLGCMVKKDGTPSPMLEDRILQGVDLYLRGVSDTLLLSGDSRMASYDEVGAMKRVSEENGVLSTAILTDGYGLSTYDSLFRAARQYGFQKIVIVTQKYHLYRAIYIAKSFGMEAYGVASDPRPYRGQWIRDLREVAARAKDFLYCRLKPSAEMGVQVWLPFEEREP